ncbi:hypothetical protein ACWF94_06845 [Streptomyces sp. NPDC055078]
MPVTLLPHDTQVPPLGAWLLNRRSSSPCLERDGTRIPLTDSADLVTRLFTELDRLTALWSNPRAVEPA